MLFIKLVGIGITIPTEEIPWSCSRLDMDCLYAEGCGVSSAECCAHLVGVDRNRVMCM